MTEQKISVGEIVKMMLLRCNVSLSALAKSLNDRYGYNITQSNLSKKLINETVRWSEFQDIASILGYKVRLDENKHWSGLGVE